MAPIRRWPPWLRATNARLPDSAAVTSIQGGYTPAMGTSNPVVFWQIRGKDMAALKEFYGSIFDWDLSGGDGSSGVPVDGRDKDDGFGLGGGLGAGRGDGWVAVFVRVQDPQVTLDEVVERGGTVILGVTERPGQATIAVFGDPEGHVIGLVKA